MTVSLANVAEAATGSSSSLGDTIGNIQVVFMGHRGAADTPSITGTGWASFILLETLVENGSNRRAIAATWREVTASDQGAFTPSWGSNSGQYVAAEFATTESGGSWVLDSSTTPATVGSDSGTDTPTSLQTALAPGSFTSSDAFAMAAAVLRRGQADVEFGADNGWTVGPVAQSGTGTSDVTVPSAYELVDTTSNGTLISWTNGAGCSSLITAFSYDTSAAASSLVARRRPLRSLIVR